MGFAFNRCRLWQLITPVGEMLSPGRSFFVSGRPRDTLPRFFCCQSGREVPDDSAPPDAGHERESSLLFDTWHRLAPQVAKSTLGTAGTSLFVASSYNSSGRVASRSGSQIATRPRVQALPDGVGEKLGTGVALTGR